jgi:hypothetical protein
MISRQFVFLGAALLFSGMSVGRAQGTSPTTSGSQSESLGDAARKARAQKKHSGKPAKVFTNDDMGRLKNTPSVIGYQFAPASGADKAAERIKDKNPANGADGKKDEASWRAKFAGARKTLADDMRELDILQRELNLKEQQFYQDPNTALKQQYSRDDVNKTQIEIDTKKQDVEKDKQALSDLEDELRKAGGDPGWASEPSR